MHLHKVTHSSNDIFFNQPLEFYDTLITTKRQYQNNGKKYVSICDVFLQLILIIPQNFEKLSNLWYLFLRKLLKIDGLKLRREGGPGSKKQVWLISKSNLSWSYYFLRNRKIFIYDENMARQSLGVLLGPIQNIGG